MPFRSNYYIILFLLLPILSQAQWTVLPFNTGYPNNAVSFVGADTGYVAGGIYTGPSPGNHEFLYKTNDGGNSWQTVYDNTDGNTVISQMTFFTDNMGVFKRWHTNMEKLNFGGTITNILSVGSSSSLDRYQALNSQDYIFSRNNTLYVTNNGGVSWNSVDLLSASTFTNGVTYAQFSDIKNGFIWGNTQYSTPTLHNDFNLYRTTDSCQTLQLSLSSSQPYQRNARIKFLSASTAIMTLDSVIMRTQDLGLTWSTIPLSTPSVLWNCMDVKNNFVVIGGTNGELLTSIDSGLTFQQFTLPGGNNINDVSVADAYTGISYAACADGIILKYNPLSTSISKVQKNEISLYPNPTTDILYLSIPDNEKEKVLVEAFDISGTMIKSFDLYSSCIYNGRLDINNFKNGYYIFKIKTNSTIHCFKILKL